MESEFNPPKEAILKRRTLVIGTLAVIATTPAYTLFGKKAYLSRADIERHIIGKRLKTSYGTWQFAGNKTFTFENRKGLFGPHSWSWYGQNSIKSPQNRYRFYETDGAIYIQSKGGSWKTQLRLSG